MKSQPQMLNDWKAGEAVVPVLLTVGFVTMYLNDIQRSGVLCSGGFGCAYDIYVIRKPMKRQRRCSQ